MNYTELKTQVAAYLHRTDNATTLQVPFFIEMAEARIGRELRALENQLSVQLAPTERLVNLPADYQQLHAVHAKIQGQERPLQRLSQARLDAMYGNTGSGASAKGPRAYAIIGKQLDARPWLADIKLQLVYWATPTKLTDQALTNAVIVAHPQLYLYGALVEGYFFTEDPDSRQGALQTFMAEVETINSAAKAASWQGGHAAGM